MTPDVGFFFTNKNLDDSYYSQYYGGDDIIFYDTHHFNQPPLETEHDYHSEITHQDIFNSVHKCLWDDVCYRGGRPCNFQYASRRMRRNFNVVMEAVRKDYRALQLASLNLRSNRDIVMEAIKTNGYALQYANWLLRNNRNFVIKAVKIDCDALGYASNRLKNDISINMEIVRNYGLHCSLFVDLYESYRQKKKLIIEAVKRFDNCSILFRQGERIPYDKDISIEILENNPMTFRYLDDRLMLDTRVIMTYLKHSTDVGAILDVENGTTALHFIFKSKAFRSMSSRRTTGCFLRKADKTFILTRDFGDAISAYV